LTVVEAENFRVGLAGKADVKNTTRRVEIFETALRTGLACRRGINLPQQRLNRGFLFLSSLADIFITGSSKL